MSSEHTKLLKEVTNSLCTAAKLTMEAGHSFPPSFIIAFNNHSIGPISIVLINTEKYTELERVSAVKELAKKLRNTFPNETINNISCILPVIIDNTKKGFQCSIYSYAHRDSYQELWQYKKKFSIHNPNEWLEWEQVLNKKLENNLIPAFWRGFNKRDSVLESIGVN